MTWLELLEKKLPLHSRVEVLPKLTKGAFGGFVSSPEGVSEEKYLGTPDPVTSYAEQACRDVPGITPEQFMALLSSDDCDDITAGLISAEALRSAARSYAEGIGNGRIRFGMDGRLIVHGVRDPEVAA